MRLYAIGDIHGRLDLLERAITAIRRDVEECGADAMTVTLGDYVDRGPDSWGVIECLSDNPFPTPYTGLKGNHEALLEKFLTDPAAGMHWQRLGGLETLQSYGVPVANLMLGSSGLMLKRTFEQTAERFRAALPAEHLNFLRSLKTTFVHGKYFLCHAGIRPSIALDRQSQNDLLWIRDEFLQSTMDFGKVIVHGHTPVSEPEVRPNRINIDTGAFWSDQLTCVALEDDGPRFLNV